MDENVKKENWFIVLVRKILLHFGIIAMSTKFKEDEILAEKAKKTLTILEENALLLEQIEKGEIGNDIESCLEIMRRKFPVHTIGFVEKLCLTLTRKIVSLLIKSDGKYVADIMSKWYYSASALENPAEELYVPVIRAGLLKTIYDHETVLRHIYNHPCRFASDAGYIQSAIIDSLKPYLQSGDKGLLEIDRRYFDEVNMKRFLEEFLSGRGISVELRGKNNDELFQDALTVMVANNAVHSFEEYWLFLRYASTLSVLGERLEVEKVICDGAHHYINTVEDLKQICKYMHSDYLYDFLLNFFEVKRIDLRPEIQWLISGISDTDHPKQQKVLTKLATNWLSTLPAPIQSGNDLVYAVHGFIGEWSNGMCNFLTKCIELNELPSLAEYASILKKVKSHWSKDCYRRVEEKVIETILPKFLPLLKSTENDALIDTFQFKKELSKEGRDLLILAYMPLASFHTSEEAVNVNR